MVERPLSAAIIKGDHIDRKYLFEESTFYENGHAEIMISTLPNYNITGFNGIDIEEILMIADEYRRCEAAMERHKAEANCDLRLSYHGGTRIYLVGDNITQESDLEVMAKIRDESHRESPKRD